MESYTQYGNKWNKKSLIKKAEWNVYFCLHVTVAFTRVFLVYNAISCPLSY